MTSVRNRAYANGLVHPIFRLTPDCLTFFRRDVQVSLRDRASVDSVKIRFVASKPDQNREGRTITRTRGARGMGAGGSPVGAFGVLVGGAPQRKPTPPRRRPVDGETSSARRNVVTRTEAMLAVVALRMMVTSAGRDFRPVFLPFGMDLGSHPPCRTGSIRDPNLTYS